MTRRAVSWLIIGTVLAFAQVIEDQSTAWATCYYQRVELVKEAAQSCFETGWFRPYDCASPGGVCCPAGRIVAWSLTYDCTTDEQVPAYGGTLDDMCPCDGTDAAKLAKYEQEAILPTNYECDVAGCGATSASDPEVCDGLDADGTLPFDEACGDDEHQCKTGDSDLAPVRFSSGRVETNPITAFQAPSPDLFFGYKLIWSSHVKRRRASSQVVNGTQDTEPTIHHSDETTHSLGKGWLDNFSDRLYIDVANKPSNVITWQSMNGTVTFSSMGSGLWKSWSGKYELVDRSASPSAGSQSDGYGRWVVRTTDTSGPRRIWAFEEFTYASYGGSTVIFTLGRLKRHAVLTSTLTNLVGRYGFTVNWTASGTISNAVDTLGRELLFSYYSSPPVSGVVHQRVLSGVQYKPASTGTPESVVTITMDLGKVHIDRIVDPVTSRYTRFRYSGICADCGTNLTDVILMGNVASTPGLDMPIQPGEIELEHNEYKKGLIDDPSYPLVLGTYSRYPGREYAYEHRTNRTTQFDLHQDTGPCSAGTCASGSACRASDSRCYVATIHDYPASTRLVPTRGPASGGTGGGGTAQTGTPRSVDRTFSSVGAPRRSTDPSGSKTTYGHDSAGRVRCMVHGDNDDEAFATPGSPDTSACAGPAGSQVIRVDYTTSSTTKTTASVLGGPDVTEVENLDSTSLLPTSFTRSGRTRDITGSNVTQTKTTTLTRDSLGRVTERNGPLTDSLALDKTTTVYYTSFDGSWPHNFGRVQSVTRYVGTSSSNQPLTTTYAKYDIFGVAREVTSPNGEVTTLTPSSDRLTWTTTVVGGALSTTSTITLDGDGNVRSALDADGTCVTYEYRDGSGNYVGAPTRIRRSDTNCGVTPININSGEVEIRTYTNNERDRLASIERRNNGTVEFTYSGFAYDVDRRVVSASTIDSATPFTFGFTDVLPTSTIAPGAPANGSWRTDTAADGFGRPTSLQRYVDASNKQTSTLSYSSPMSPRPTQLTRGYNGSSTATTTFVYDDFSRLVESVVPEVGVPGAPRATRFEYDVADRMVKKRVGVSAADQRTSDYVYDSLGRTISVDHDTEHPVNCASAPADTAIQDEEYKYDNCTGDAPAGFSCTNALGRLTISRAVLRCGAANDVIKSGRWYAWDSLGRLSKIAYANVIGSTIGTPAISDYVFSSAGRLRGQGSPLNSAFGTRYSLGASGRPTTIQTTAFTTIASGLTYRSFGPLTGLTTAVVQPVAGGGTRTLQLNATYRSNDTLQNLNWALVGTGASTITLMNAGMSYGPAGLLTNRTDTADGLNSRFYKYDALARLTCEARGDGTTNPSNSDCVTSSSRLAGLFTYGNGQSATSPPDVRLTSFIKNAGTVGASYTSPSTETYTYSSGSGQTQQINRTGSNIVIAYDSIGRRTSEHDSADSIKSKRQYVYLPNGQLGKIKGSLASGTKYTASVAYDPEGRPVLIAMDAGATTTYELFWDDSTRLIAVSIDGGSIRWHYHYHGKTVIAATREVGSNVKRFWTIVDERGLVYRMLDETGATFWQARWDNVGWRNLVGSPLPNTWLPLGLGGHIIIDGTRAYSGASTTTVRSEVSLSHWRTHDPFWGAFQQPDTVDQYARLLPEGYTYGRNNAMGFEDSNGRKARASDIAAGRIYQSMLDFDDSCYSFDQEAIGTAVASAIRQILDCSKGSCSGSRQEHFRREWIYSLIANNYHCPRLSSDLPKDLTLSQSRYIFDGKDEIRGVTMISVPPSINMHIAPALLEAPDASCLTRTVAHEALHWTHNVVPAYVFLGIERGWGGVGMYGMSTNNFLVNFGTRRSVNGSLVDEEEALVQDTIDGCVSCE